MTWGYRAQRRADEFEALVEGLSTSEATAASRDAELLELVGAMRAVPEVQARPEFVTDLRALLMAEAETALVPADVSRLRLPERRPTRERRLAALVGGIAIVGATTSVAVASQGALPGDSLYPIKRAIEGAHTGLSVGEGNKGTTVLANASDRLAEVDALTRRDGVADDLRIADTLTTFTDQATEASDLLLSDYAHTGDESSISALREFSAASLATLAGLEPQVPADARDELIRAAQVLGTIDAEAAMRCPSCDGASVASIPPGLLPVAEPIFVPVAPDPVAEPTAHGGKKHGSKNAGKGDHSGTDDGDDPNLPDVPSEGVGPGSVLNPGGGSSPGTTTQNPIQQLVDGVTGGLTGGGQHAPADQPSSSILDDPIGTIGGLLQDVVDPLTGTKSGD